MNNVRVSAKAVIIRDGKLLAMKHKSDDGDYFILPGGGQRNGEDLSSAVRRECLEEAGIRIEVGDVVFIRDYIADNHEFAEYSPGFHQVEIMFSCDILNDNEIGMGGCMDDKQVGIAWLPLNNLEQMNLYPKILKSVIGNPGTKIIYLGDAN